MNARHLVRLKNRILNLVRRGRVVEVNDGGPVQVFVVRGLEKERIPNVARVGQFGFASHPPPGSHAILVCPQGDAGRAVAVAVEHAASRPRGLSPGDSWIYDSRGQAVRLHEGGIEVLCKGDLEAEVEGDLRAEVEGDVDLDAGGDANLKAGGKATIEAGEAEIDAGGSTIEVGSGGVEITGATISLTAAAVTITGAQIKMVGADGEVEFFEHTHGGVQTGDSETGEVET